MAEGRTNWPKVEDDWFVEPIAATEFLLKRESFAGMVVWDPACGQGNIVNTLIAAGVKAYGNDTHKRTMEPWFTGALNFLEPHRPIYPGFDAVVTNPPYGHAKLAEAFIRKALAYDDLRKLAVFVNAKFLFSARRSAGLYSEFPPSRVYPVLPRPSCPPGALLAAGKVKAEGGVENFVWIVWDRTLHLSSGKTEIHLGARP